MIKKALLDSYNDGLIDVEYTLKICEIFTQCCEDEDLKIVDVTEIIKDLRLLLPRVVLETEEVIKRNKYLKYMKLVE